MAEHFCSSLHPLTPPLKEEERLSWLRLIRSRKVGVATFHRLLKEHGSASAALDALPKIAEAAGVKDYEVFSSAAAQAELKAGQRAKARLIAMGDPDYPAALLELNDAPPLIWAVGTPEIMTKPKVAMVGARNASSLGTRMARRLAADLSDAGFVVVSGLARGVDAAAHTGALEGGTIAVMAGGVDVLYPAENADLAVKIAESGVRISEMPFGCEPRARHFPQRNRLISGLSQGVVVVEAAAQSGSLITARNALDQGRDVFAVPGHPFDGRAAGGNLLIRDGAMLVRNANDVIEALESTAMELPLAPPDHKPPTELHPDTANLHREILDRLGPSPVAEDQLIRDLGRPASQVSPELFSLEVEGRIARAPGGLLSLNPQPTD